MLKEKPSHSGLTLPFCIFVLLLLCSIQARGQASPKIGAEGNEELLTGFVLKNREFHGPGEWRESFEPIWVYAYHRLRLQYRATAVPLDTMPVLTLRPGSVGPVTPGATNRENPFVTGVSVVVIRPRDLIADGTSQTLELDLQGKVRTPQIDALQFTLSAGASLVVEELRFLADPEILPCDSPGDAAKLPTSAERLSFHGPLNCNGAAATSVRGRETILISGENRTGQSVYLSLVVHFLGVSNLSFDGPLDIGLKESSETAHVIARTKYSDKSGGFEEQFPLLVAERRHVLLNRKPATYALPLDPSRPVAAIELLDRSAHAQLLLFAAGISQDSIGEVEVGNLPPPVRRLQQPFVRPSLESSGWFRIQSPKGDTILPEVLRPNLGVKSEEDRQVASLTLQNTGKGPLEFELSFPSLVISTPASPQEVYYLFPRQGAIISYIDTTLENFYGGAFPLQFVDVFSPSANSGTCVLTADTIGTPKTFWLRKRGGKVQVEVRYTIRLAPGETYRPPEAIVSYHRGDWHEGFEAYRSWLARWYKPRGPRPQWLQKVFWCRRDYPIGGSGKLFDVRTNRYTFEKLLTDGEAFGGVDFIDISGWALSDTLGRVGDYPIELGGAEDFRRNISLAKGRGIRTGLYFEGYLIDKNSQVGRKYGRQWQLIGEDGQPRWWPGGSPELFVCPHLPAWHQYLSGRMVEVVKEVAASALYFDQHGFCDRGKSCYSTSHGHPPGAAPISGEVAMAKEARRRFEAAGLGETVFYLEEAPPDVLAPYYDAAFCYAIPHANSILSPLKLNLFRFAFPDIRLWDMLSIGIHPRVLSIEDFRMSLWHGNGVWLKGHSETWYGEEILSFLRRSRELLHKYASAFAGKGDPLVESPHPAIFVNRFTGGGQTVFTLFNASYCTVRFSFLGQERLLGPRDVEVVASQP